MILIFILELFLLKLVIGGNRYSFKNGDEKNISIVEGEIYSFGGHAKQYQRILMSLYILNNTEPLVKRDGYCIAGISEYINKTQIYYKDGIKLEFKKSSIQNYYVVTGEFDILYNTSNWVEMNVTAAYNASIIYLFSYGGYTSDLLRGYAQSHFYLTKLFPYHFFMEVKKGDKLNANVTVYGLDTLENLKITFNLFSDRGTGNITRKIIRNATTVTKYGYGLSLFFPSLIIEDENVTYISCEVVPKIDIEQLRVKFDDEPEKIEEEETPNSSEPEQQSSLWIVITIIVVVILILVLVGVFFIIRSRRLKSSEENVDDVNNSSIIPPSQNNGNGNAYEMNQMNE